MNEVALVRSPQAGVAAREKRSSSRLLRIGDGVVMIRGEIYDYLNEFPKIRWR